MEINVHILERFAGAKLEIRFLEQIDTLKYIRGHLDWNGRRYTINI